MDLLVAARARLATFPAVVSVVPEGLEDIDCDLADGRRLLVQTKERGPGGRPVGIADVAQAIAHAAKALTGDGATLDESASFALVTDGDLSAGIVETGWHSTLADTLIDRDGGHDTLGSLNDAVAQLLSTIGLQTDLAGDLIASTSVVRLTWHVSAHTEVTLRDQVGLEPTLAWLVYGRLAVNIANVAADQRSRGRQNAQRRTVGDLDALITAVRESVDINGLDAAVRAGVARPIDFTRPSNLDRAAFFAGVDVTPAHVAANLDVMRVEELSTVADGLAASGHVVIAGPSGGGKSALMWRAGRDVGRGGRPLQVLRCSSDDDVTLLVRHVRQQQPTRQTPILVCTDDLGRDTLTHWPAARDQLLGEPGVMLLGTVRREDFTARFAGSATVVDPRLRTSSAAEIYRQIETSGLQPRLEEEEAISRADGLLMEFISLVTTGQRIRTVLRGQVEALMQPARRLQRVCLRLVTAAHTMGSAVNADDLGAYLIASQAGITIDDVGAALDVLRGEHLLQPGPDGFWRGLHDLRTEVLVELLHVAPPPTLAATYAEVLRLLPPARRGDAIRRAAERICAGAPLAPIDAAVTLENYTAMFEPLADAAGQLIAALPAGAAVHATDLLEGSVRADAAIYAAATLPFLRTHQPGRLDPYDLAFLAYGMRNAGIGLPVPQLAEIAARLPTDDGAVHKRVGSHLSAEQLAALATAGPLPTAVALLEAAEQATTILPDVAAAIWSHHVPSLPSPAGEGFDLAAADQRARLAASLATLAGLTGSNVATVLGPAADRVADAAAAEPYGLTIDISLTEHNPADDTLSELVRQDTYATGELLVCRARKLADPSTYQRMTAYPIAKAQMAGDGGVNDQAVHLARRLLDIAPEVDRADIEVLAADLHPVRVGNQDVGVKRLRHGVIQRGPQTRVRVAFQAAVARLLAAGSWSERLRQQAKAAADLVLLLEQLPLRLRSHDTPRRRRDLLDQTTQVQAAVVALPLRPNDDTSIGTWSGPIDHQAQDEQGRAKDRARDALGQVAGALGQIAAGLSDGNQAAVRGAGYRFAELPTDLGAARADGAPTFANVGNTLPEQLDELCGLVAELLLALEHAPQAQSVLDKGSIHAPVDLARRAVAEAADIQTRRDLDVVRAWFATQDIPAELHVIPDDNRPPGAVSRQQILATVPHDRWADTVHALQHWPTDTRPDLVGAVVAAPVDQYQLLSMAVRLGGIGAAYPVTDVAVIEHAGAAVRKPVTTENPLAHEIDQILATLVTTSLEMVRDANRNPSWAQPLLTGADPADIVEGLKRQYSTELADPDQESNPVAAAIGLLSTLCEQVATEDGSGDGLAASVASIDWADLAKSSTNPYIAAINATLALGLYAKPRAESYGVSAEGL